MISWFFNTVNNNSPAFYEGLFHHLISKASFYFYLHYKNSSFMKTAGKTGSSLITLLVDSSFMKTAGKTGSSLITLLVDSSFMKIAGKTGSSVIT